jgi:hypothetical protein
MSETITMAAGFYILGFVILGFLVVTIMNGMRDSEASFKAQIKTIIDADIEEHRTSDRVQKK